MPRALGNTLDGYRVPFFKWVRNSERTYGVCKRLARPNKPGDDRFHAVTWMPSFIEVTQWLSRTCQNSDREVDGKFAGFETASADTCKYLPCTWQCVSYLW